MIRPAVFFVAYVVMMVATFPDAAALLPASVNPLLLYVPAAIAAAAVLAHARIPPRLPGNPVWYAVLAVLAIAQFASPFLGVVLFAAPFVALPYLAIVKPLLMLAVVLVLLRLRPRVGDLHAAEVMPGFTAFVALTALTHSSFAIVKDLAAAGMTHPMIEKVPGPMANFVAAAVIAAAFIALSGIRHRALQLSPAKAWLVPGIVLWYASAVAMHFAATREYAPYGLVAGHVMLFIGATYLLSHLLPRREADELA